MPGQDKSAATPPQALPAEAVVHRCDPAALGFATTADVEADVTLVGQERALSALEFGARIPHEGFNLYVLGNPGSSRHEVTLEMLRREAQRRKPATDWCYVNNFEDPQKPKGLPLPAGVGLKLKQDVTRLIEELRVSIPAAFESENYRNRRAEIEQAFEDRNKKAMEAIQEEAENANLGLLPTPHGFALAPIRDGAVLGEKDFDALPAAEQKQIEKDIDRLTDRLRQHFENVPNWHKEKREEIRDLDANVTNLAVGALISTLREGYKEMPPATEFLDALKADVIERAQEFRIPEDQANLPPGMRVDTSRLFRRYEVNVLVSAAPGAEAAVVYESNPTHQNLVGHIEHTQQYGNLITDFTMIRAGALHRASAGYLVLDAEKVLMQPFAWDALKRALKNREVRIESVAQLLSLMSAESLEPDPMPLDVKVALVGNRLLYYLLCQLDPDFPQLFKVAADFEDRIPRTAENVPLYGQMLATIVQRKELLPFSAAAIARVIEESSRTAGDSDKLSAGVERVTDLLSEADFLGRERGVEQAEAQDVDLAVERRTHRLDRLRTETLEAIERNTIHVRTEGERPGQVNGLSVIQLGEFAFGQPARITATVRLGEGRVIDIERESELGGSIHSKGVLILSALLGARYSRDVPLSLGASLVFEQSYGGVDGDSASVAEFVALISAIAEIPVKQNLAVTGSVDQHGRMQAIGGVNQKIEGFFDICNARGLTGDQGVLIPADNEQHLMLRGDVVTAIAEGRFHVYPLQNVDQAISLLTGRDAGSRDEDGVFPVNSVNRSVENVLRSMAEHRREFAAKPAKQKRRTPKDGE
ncbi:MAG: AAA family ATPase [Chromatiales bacterium]|nr:MAG: AAA family ATPase [Chromatiales bacterium]